MFMKTPITSGKYAVITSKYRLNVMRQAQILSSRFSLTKNPSNAAFAFDGHEIQEEIVFRCEAG